MRCPRCQQEGEDKHRYCARCGCALDVSTPSDEDSCRQWLEEAKQCYRDGQKDKALTLFERLARTVPDVSGEVYSYLGALYSEMGRPKDAVAAFLASVQQQPNSPKTYFNLGVACRMQGLITEAVTCFRAALRVNPDFSAAQSSLREMLATLSPAIEQLTAELRRLRNDGDEQQKRLIAGKILALQSN
ncbi:MAG TPA: tetratricopeptide repeat protein [Armatimonadota bacterium]|nr:tetratricopeptide repeat protein [Armatimonadota bacterium]